MISLQNLASVRILILFCEFLPKFSQNIVSIILTIKQATLWSITTLISPNMSPHRISEDGSAQEAPPYTVLEQPLGTTRHLRVITIGAGISGLNMIRTLRKTMTDYEHVVYEKNPEVGGTWYENTYPGTSETPQIP